MSKAISRRDFLKVTGAVGAALYRAKFVPALEKSRG